MVRCAFVVLLMLTLLVRVPVTSRAQEATPQPTQTTSATPVSPDAEIITEVLATIRLPAAAIPPSPAIVDVWLWSLRPGEEDTYASAAQPSIAADVVLEGAYAVESEGRLQVQRATGLEEVPAGTVVTVRPGDAVIYVENQAAQIMRNPAAAAARVISIQVFAADPASDEPESTVASSRMSSEDWERSGLVGQDVLVRVERLTVPPGASLPAVVPEVQTPQFFAVARGLTQWTISAPGAATPAAAVPFARNEVLWFRALGEGEQLHLQNPGDRPLVLLQVTLSADSKATPVAATPMS